MLRAGSVVGLLVLASCRCGSKPATGTVVRQSAPAPVVTVPRATSAIKIDGELEEDAWRHTFRSQPFEDSRGKSAPFADISAIADDENLYLMVYVADGDLRSDGDRVTINVGTLQLVVNPKSAKVPAGVLVGTDIDGTPDDPSDDDEEWISEIAIPWKLLGSKRVPLRAVRIDGGKAERPHAFAWPRTEPAILDFSGTAPAASK